MRYLLDTNVVSALRVRGRNLAVEAWATTVPLGDQFISAFTVAEIERGVVAKERADESQGAVLRRWFEDNVLPAFADRVSPSRCGTAVSLQLQLQLQVEAKCVVEVHHNVHGGAPEDRAKPLDCDGADLLALGFRVLAKAGHGRG